MWIVWITAAKIQLHVREWSKFGSPQVLLSCSHLEGCSSLLTSLPNSMLFALCSRLSTQQPAKCKFLSWSVPSQEEHSIKSRPWPTRSSLLSAPPTLASLSPVLTLASWAPTRNSSLCTCCSFCLACFSRRISNGWTLTSSGCSNVTSSEALPFTPSQSSRHPP